VALRALAADGEPDPITAAPFSTLTSGDVHAVGSAVRDAAQKIEDRLSKGRTD
jgi:hypothetical protein